MKDMTVSRRVLCGVYGLIALLALVTTWNQNLQFMAPASVATSAPGTSVPGSGLAQFWLATLANHATTSITVDLFLLLFAAVIWMVIEARRIGVRFVWAYVVFAMLVAISVTFPLFMIARELRIAAQPLASAREGDAALGLLTRDWLGFVLLAVPCLAFSVWTLAH